MRQEKSPNIFNISANFHFFESFLFWFLQNFSDKKNINIIFPSRRACREFENILKIKNISVAKIKAIADIKIADFYDFFDFKIAQEIENEISQIKILKDLDYLFFLSQEIINSNILPNINFNYAFDLAISLKNLFDDIEKFEVDIDEIYKIDDSELSKHRQFSLEFLKDFYHKIKNQTIKKNIFSQIALQNFLIKKLNENIEKFGLKNEVIIVGSTGSVNLSKKFIKSVSKQKNGYVVLYGLNQNYQAFEDEKDPQFLLNDLLKFINVEKKSVKEIIFKEFQLSNFERNDFIIESLRPSDTTYNWHLKKFNQEILLQDLEKNLVYFLAKNEIEEAKIIANQAFEAFGNNKKIAIIVNDYNFSKILKNELRKNNLYFNDTRSLDLSDSKLINLFLLFLELIENDFESATLLAIFKHVYSPYLQNFNLIENFEKNVLRQARKGLGLKFLQEKIAFCEKDLQDFFKDFLTKIKILNKENKINIADYFSDLITTIENFSQKNINELVALEAAKIEISEFFEKIKNLNLVIKKSEIKEFFTKLFFRISYFEKSDSSAFIQIISTIEARLLNFDLIIISNLNDKKFPQIDGENWLGRSIRKKLSIDLSSRKYGQNAYDFCNYLANKSVILTSRKTNNQALCLESPFILRLDILCKKINFNLRNQNKYDEIIKKINDFEEKNIVIPFSVLNRALNLKTVGSRKPITIGAQSRVLKNSIASFKNGNGIAQKLEKYAFVPYEFRPKKFAITEISKLILDPYSIYAKKILQLKKLEKIDYEAGAKEFGSFVHKALEEFVKNKNSKEDFLIVIQKIFLKYFANEESLLIWWPKFCNIFDEFLKINNNLDPLFESVEEPFVMRIKNIDLVGKIDRIINFKNDEFEIIDYKTGQIPAKKDIINGNEPQLALCALMLLYGKGQNKKINEIVDKKISALKYWKLSSYSDSQIEIIFNNESVKSAISAAKEGLEELFDYYNDEKNFYQIGDVDKKYDEYWHLKRKI